MRMKKCLFLIPTSYNNGAEVSGDVILEVIETLYEEFGAVSQGGIAKGFWKMGDGSKAKDNSLIMWIVITEEKVPLLKKMIKKFAHLLKQEAIYLEIMDCDIDFIGPD